MLHKDNFKYNNDSNYQISFIDKKSSNFLKLTPITIVIDYNMVHKHNFQLILMATAF